MPTTTASFQTERQAKEYLVERIVAEAECEQVPLSEVERKMLYFTESGWTLPNILEVNAEFERDYDNDEYEQKIAELVRQIDKHNEITGGDDQAKWDDAIVKLGEGDHYLLVLVGLGRSSPAGQFSKWLPTGNFYGTGKVRPPGDALRLIVVALALAAFMFAAVVIEAWLKK
ncbi:MAG: hypothetical protein WCA10_00310 [Terracidiphilus sp.]